MGWDEMLIKSMRLWAHPILGDIDLDFSDDTGAPFSTIIFAGGNGCGKTAILETIHKIFEWHPQPWRGAFEIILLLDAKNVDQLVRANFIEFGQKVDSLRIAFSNFEGETDWKFHFVRADEVFSAFGYGLVSDQMGKEIFRSFLTEADVSFTAGRVSSVTTLDLDSPRQLSARSGSELARQVSQLLVDIRASDAEELQQWVEANPSQSVLADLINRRMKRFTDAFDYIFPTKRFRNIARGDNSLEIQFEEFGRITNINQLSTGEKQIVFRGGFVLKNLSHVQSGILLVDEPELSLHPEWQSRILGFYQRLIPVTERSSTQLFVATHSPFIVHNAAGAKVIILEKDIMGVVRTMRQPIYPAVSGNLGIVAFNIDPFLSSAKYNLLVLVEGDSDALILETAWKKLYPNERRFFEFRSALGAKNISITLNDGRLFAKVGRQKMVGILDFDEAYNQWKGIWPKTQVVEGEPENGICRKHPSEAAWAMLLPVPDYRQNFASVELGGQSILSMEFLFKDEDIPAEFMGFSLRPLGRSIPVFRDSKKMEFARHVDALPPDSFVSFTPIFDRLRQIEGRTI